MSQEQQLQLRQIDHDLKKLSSINIQKPRTGWINTIRTAISMSTSQLAKRLNISQQAVSNLEKREQEETITLAKLREIGEKLNLELVYGFVSKSSLEKMIQERAKEIATDIVMKTNQQMILEDQKVEYRKLEKAIKSRAEDIAKKIPKYLWD